MRKAKKGKINKTNKCPLFTLGKWLGPNKQILEVNIFPGLKIPTDRRQASWLFTSVAEELNSGLP